MIDLPESIRPQFEQAGWTPDRCVNVPAAAPLGHVGRELLERFGGLTVGHCGAGEECATNDISFRPVGDDPEYIGEWEQLLKTELVGVAEYHHAHGELYVARDARCFGLDLTGAFVFVGQTVGEALENLLLGRRSQPMLHPDEQEVWLYGDRYGPEHPAVYRY